MKIFNKKIKYSGLISTDTLIGGTSKGHLTLDNCSVIIDGMHKGTINCTPNSTLEVNGMLKGTITNSGGYVKITGIINGKINTIDGQTIIDETAIIK